MAPSERDASRQDYVAYDANCFLYEPEREGVYPIKEQYWKMLKGKIKNINQKNNFFIIFASICMGFFSNGVFSLIALSTVEDIDPWVFPVTCSLVVCSLIIAIINFVYDKMQTKIISSSKDELQNLVDCIEEPFKKSKQNNKLIIS